jgi:hypothetical protein
MVYTRFTRTSCAHVQNSSKGPRDFPEERCVWQQLYAGSILLILSQEATRRTIDLPEDEEQTIKLLIQYLYEGEYDPKVPRDGPGQVSRVEFVVSVPKEDRFHYGFPHTCEPRCPEKFRVCPHHSCLKVTCGEACEGFVCYQCCDIPFVEGGPQQMVLHAKMYELGEKYVVEGLKELAKDKFARSCRFYWNTPHFAAAVEHVFSSTVESDMGLRDIVIETISLHTNVLNMPGMRDVLNQFNDLAVGLLIIKAPLIGWDRTHD